MHVTSPLREDLSEGLDIPGAPFGVTHGSSPYNQDKSHHSVKVMGYPCIAGHLKLAVHGTFYPPPSELYMIKCKSIRECNRLDCSRIHNTSEAGIATYHVRASGQSHLQQFLSISITVLALRGQGVALSILLVNPTIRFICRKAEWTRMLFPLISLGPVTDKPNFPTTLTGKSHFRLLPPT